MISAGTGAPALPSAPSATEDAAPPRRWSVRRWRLASAYARAASGGSAGTAGGAGPLPPRPSGERAAAEAGLPSASPRRVTGGARPAASESPAAAGPAVAGGAGAGPPNCGWRSSPSAGWRCGAPRGRGAPLSPSRSPASAPPPGVSRQHAGCAPRPRRAINCGRRQCNSSSLRLRARRRAERGGEREEQAGGYSQLPGRKRHALSVLNRSGYSH